MSLPPELEFEIVNALPNLKGWCTQQKALALAECVVETRPRVAIEVGTFGGKSAIPLAMALRANGIAAKLYCIDPYLGAACTEGDADPRNSAWWLAQNLDGICRDFMDAIYSHGLQVWSVLLRAESQHCADLFPEIDLAHLDGNHSELASTRDVALYLPKLRKDGYLIFDDANWSSTQRAVGMVLDQCDAVADIGDPRTTFSRIFRKR